jgi:hypothetical protein
MDYMWCDFAAGSWEVNTDQSLATCLASRKVGNIRHADMVIYGFTKHVIFSDGTCSSVTYVAC